MEMDNGRIDSFDYRIELLSPALSSSSSSKHKKGPVPTTTSTTSTTYNDDDGPSWRISFDHFRNLSPPRHHHQVHTSSTTTAAAGFCFWKFLQAPRRRRKIEQYYKRQQQLIQGFSEVDEFLDLGCSPGSLTEKERNLKQVARGERIAINASNIANFMLFVAKVYASVESRSLAVIASTLDSLLDLLSGLILWFTAHAMNKPNPYTYPAGKKRMQPVGVVVFATVMATLGLQVLFESARELIVKSQPERNSEKEKWMIGIMVSVTVVKFILMQYCRQFKNEIVRAYAQDHFFDVITNSVGLAAAVLAIRFFWWIDPVGAIIIALYTMRTWAKTVMENVGWLIGRTAPGEYITKLVYLVWNHHEDIKHIATVRAYTYGSSQYFVEVDIVVSQDMALHHAHDIGETLQHKLQLLPQVQRAFVHVDSSPRATQHKPSNK